VALVYLRLLYQRSGKALERQHHRDEREQQRDCGVPELSGSHESGQHDRCSEREDLPDDAPHREPPHAAQR
jgi:hypothetical protein